MKTTSETELARRKKQSEEQKQKNKRLEKIRDIISSVPLEVILNEDE